MKEYVFSAPCPPQALKAHLSRQVAVMQAGFGKAVKLKLKWRGALSFKLRGVFFKKSDGIQSVGLGKDKDILEESAIYKHQSIVGAGTEPNISFQATFGAYIIFERKISEPFCATIEPDTGGGSVLRGHFPFWSLSTLWITALGMLALTVALWAKSPLIAAAALPLTLWYLYYHWRRKDRCSDSQWILETLQQLVQTAPLEQESEP